MNGGARATAISGVTIGRGGTTTETFGCGLFNLTDNFSLSLNLWDDAQGMPAPGGAAVVFVADAGATVPVTAWPQGLSGPVALSLLNFLGFDHLSDAGFTDVVSDDAVAGCVGKGTATFSPWPPVGGQQLTVTFSSDAELCGVSAGIAPVNVTLAGQASGVVNVLP